MQDATIKTLQGIGFMIGGIVGVGVFGLPYAFAQSGVAIGLLHLLVIGVVMILLQLMIAEIVVQTNGKQRLVGYVSRYLGKQWGTVMLVALAAGLWGAMLAFMIAGGDFLQLLLDPVFGEQRVLYALLVGVFASILLSRGLTSVSKIEAPIVVLLLFLFIFIMLAALPHMQAEFVTATASQNAFLPYGVVLFSLAGLAVVPEVSGILGQRYRNRLGSVVLSGMAVIIALYASFATIVAGVTGPETTQVAFDGLVPMLGGTFGIVGALLGLVVIFSIYTTVGIELMDTFQFDFHIPHSISWVLATITPILFYIVGLRDFVELIGFVGACLVGFMAVLVVCTYENMRRSPVCRAHKCLNIPTWLSGVIVLIFVSGAALEIWSLISSL